MIYSKRSEGNFQFPRKVLNLQTTGRMREKKKQHLSPDHYTNDQKWGLNNIHRNRIGLKKRVFSSFSGDKLIEKSFIPIM